MFFKITSFQCPLSVVIFSLISEKITTERGHWKEVILKNKTFPLMITFNPSYLIRFPENKKHSWEDLKKIRDKIKDLKLKI